MNLHVETENYEVGDKVKVEIEVPNGKVLKFNLQVFDNNKAIMKNIFDNTTIELEGEI